MNIVNLIKEHAKKSPDHPALIEPHRSFSYRELIRTTEQWAAALESSGLGPGDRLGICLRDNAEHVIAMLAAAELGATIVPLDWRAPPTETERLASIFSTSLVLVEAGWPTPDNTRCITIDAAWQATIDGQTGTVTAHQGGDTPLIIKLSSGTTGVPKGAVVTHQQFLSRTTLNVSSYGPLQGDRYLSVSPLYFGAGSHFVKSHLVLGNTVILYPPLFTAEEFADTVALYDATVLFLVPTVLHRLLDLDITNTPLFPNVNTLIISGALIGAEEKLKISQRLCPNLFESFATSAAGPIAVLKPSDLTKHAGSVGRPVTGVELEIVDENDNPLPPKTIGKIRCRGSAMSMDFLSDPNSPEPQEHAQDDWYYPGDLAEIDRDGYIYLKGRTDDTIIRGGINIYPAALETALLLHPTVSEAAVIARQSAEFGEEPVAFIVPAGEADSGELLTHCRQQLSAEQLPVEIRIVNDLPKTTSGKIQRTELVNLLSQTYQEKPQQ